MHRTTVIKVAKPRGTGSGYMRMILNKLDNIELRVARTETRLCKLAERLHIDVTRRTNR